MTCLYIYIYIVTFQGRKSFCFYFLFSCPLEDYLVVTDGHRIEQMLSLRRHCGNQFKNVLGTCQHWRINNNTGPVPDQFFVSFNYIPTVEKR